MKDKFDAFRAFDFGAANVQLWVFRQSTTDRKFKALSVRTDAELDGLLKEFAMSEIERITEFLPYSYLSQVNENGCLAVSVDETNFAFLQAAVDLPPQEHQATQRKHLVGVTGYVVRFEHDGQTVYATRRSPQSWKTKHQKGRVINMAFRNGELSAVEEKDFSLDPHFDLFCYDGMAFIANKKGFESVMQYKTGYVEAFSQMQNKPEFIALFSDMQILVDAVGANSTQLRRMAVIQEKNLYGDDKFMPSVREVCKKRNWPIKFSDDGKIIPEPETVGVILKILLDQRLLSEVTLKMYDVPDGQVVV
ncbi:DUF4868 domain-containing protein [Luteibacter jiangsuensis]|uniref:DUF4868 domain-containing protein n=1 Tax=Luteibacter jiangsuensis TaxID=637577 RepID=A0ABX0Q5S7_9GAMM|nr:Kiwa anti-phage protein KwaB-like domain-containing protein [Luteibacter jiangsuensis]NID05890.1 DUF4868 domain-containing protein [Luteibacter jiangsuensis]